MEVNSRFLLGIIFSKARLKASSIAVRALAYCAEDCGSAPTWNH